VFVKSKRFKATQGLWILLTQSRPEKSWSLIRTDKHISNYSCNLTPTELIIVPRARSKQTKDLNIRNCLQTQRTALGIVDLIVIFLSKIYYDPKYSAGFGSVAKLVKSSKNKKRNVEDWLYGQNTYSLHKSVLML